MDIDGFYVPPEEGSEPCWFYEESGVGVGLETDAMPQCASCGHRFTDHTKTWEDWCEALEKIAISSDWCLSGFEPWRGYFDFKYSPETAFELGVSPGCHEEPDTKSLGLTPRFKDN